MAHAESSAIIESAEITRLLLDMGMEPIGNLPADADAAYRQRLPVMLEAVRHTGVTLD